MKSYPFTVDRPRSNVSVGVIAWNDTHVLIDVFVGGKLKTQRLRRPIERFMIDYALQA